MGRGVRAHVVANLVFGVAGAAAGYFVLKNPTLRRAAWRVLKISLTTAIPRYLLREATEAWRETGQRVA